MATARIRIDQPGHSTTPIGVPGRARRDLELGTAVIFRNSDDTGVLRHRWQLRDAPIGSTATLSDPTAPQVSFTPDVAGSYRVTLTTNDGLAGEVDTKVGAVLSDAGDRFPAVGEQASEVNWLVSGGENEAGWGKDVEAILRKAASSGQVEVYSYTSTGIFETVADLGEVPEDMVWVIEATIGASSGGVSRGA